MIRYRTRDLTRLLPATSRPMRRLGKIVGRSDDMLIVRGVNLFPTQIEELILAEPAFAPHFRLEITRPARLDEVALYVEMRASDDPTAREACKRLQARMKDLIGLTASVEAAAPGTIERSAGKIRRVFDRRAPAR
jgi:phenylacetate-CoA ligase